MWLLAGDHRLHENDPSAHLAGNLPRIPGRILLEVLPPLSFGAGTCRFEVPPWKLAGCRMRAPEVAAAESLF